MKVKSKNFTNWYAKSVEETLTILETSEHGLDEKEAQSRFLRDGPNKLADFKSENILTIFLRQFKSPLIYILLVSSVIVFWLGEKTDAYIILFVLLVNAFIGGFQEGRAQNTLLALKNFTKTETAVVRNGGELVLEDCLLVIGDIIVLREGDKVPADCRVIEAKNFNIDESALTGESETVEKNTSVLLDKSIATADQKNMIFKGTFVATGLARAVVTSAGMNTVIGKISQKIVTIDSEIPLKEDMKKLSQIISMTVAVLVVVVFFIGIFYGNSAREMFFTSVAVAVSLIPEGLPIVITLVLATGVYRMAKKNALVKKLQAVEALGQARIIAVDKTGTITKNELMVEKVFVDGNEFTIRGNGYEPKGEIHLRENAINPLNHPELIFMGKIATFSASARVSFFEKAGLWKVSGDPTEGALLVFGNKIGFNKDDLEKEEPQVFEVPFNSSVKYHATVHNVKGKKFLTIVGAPEAVLALSKFYQSRGENLKMTDDARAKFELELHLMSRKGLRVIASAIDDDAPSEVSVNDFSKLSFVGLFGMRDVLREGVRESIQEAEENGIRVAMITGDHKVTAEAIAREAGIFKEGNHIITGADMETMDKKELLGRLGKTTVFARVAPEHKLKIIEAYKERGEIIAMTGDGVNDALSLVAADLGIAMGKIGTEVAKEAADIVLLDDNFRSIVAAIEEGRSIYKSIKKVILYLFSTGVGEFLTIVGALLLFMPLPLFPSQILWLNLVTDGFLVVALAMEPKEKLNKRKRGANKRFFIDSLMLGRIFLMGFAMTIGTLFLFSSTYQMDIAKGSTIALTALAIFQWFNAWNCRSEEKSLFASNPFNNLYLVGATLIVIALQIFAIYNPLMQIILKTVPLTLSEWILIVAVASTIILAEEIRKFVYRHSKIRDISYLPAGISDVGGI